MFLFASIAALSTAPLSSSTPTVPRLEAPAPIVQDGEEDTGWHGTVNVGFNNTNGNTNTTAVAASANAERRDGDDRYNGRFYYNYTENRPTAETIQDNRGLGLEYNRFMNERLYLLAKADVDTDEVAQLDQRSALGVGAGYQFYDTEEFSLNGELGVATVDEDYSVDASDTDYIASQLAVQANWQVNEDVLLGYIASYIQSLDDSRDLIIRSDLKATTTLGESMIGSVQYVMDYDNTPVAGNTRSDHRFVVSVGWSF